MKFPLIINSIISLVVDISSCLFLKVIAQVLIQSSRSVLVIIGLISNWCLKLLLGFDEGDAN